MHLQLLPGEVARLQTPHSTAPQPTANTDRARVNDDAGARDFHYTGTALNPNGSPDFLALGSQLPYCNSQMI